MTEWIGSPVAGKGKRLEELNDEMFASRALGDGFAVKPPELFAKKEVVSPAEGEVTMVYETGHALGLLTTGGHELLIHIGIDTVELNGKPFKERVKIGDSVSRGDLLLEVDFPMIKKSGYDTTVMLIATNRKIQLIKDTGQISMYEPVFRLL